MNKTKNSIGKKTKKRSIKKFSGQFWLVVIFEFFERGAYYGMMSFISVYFTDILFIPKENVGIIKGVIQPLLYFLPIISGAIADRFGYRKVLMIAFALMGGGYFLTSQATEYTTVFIALVVMGFGAGTFKPIISGTIARVTDESSSTMGFGIYYWTINMGAFLFPLILVPFLKSINPTYVIIASAICTAAMLIPTAFFFKEPVKLEKSQKRENTSMIQTLANAFEIIYSPIVLLYLNLKKTTFRKVLIILILAGLLVYSIPNYLKQSPATEKFSAVGIKKGNTTLIFKVERNMQAKNDFELKIPADPQEPFHVTIFKPLNFKVFSAGLVQELNKLAGFESLSESDLRQYLNLSDQKIELIFEKKESLSDPFKLVKMSDSAYKVVLKNHTFPEYKNDILKKIQEIPLLRGIQLKDCIRLYNEVNSRSFFPLFVVSVFLIGLLITAFSIKKINQNSSHQQGFHPIIFLLPMVILILWFLPGLSTLGRIISSVIYLSVMSLFIIDKTDVSKFADHAKFLLMIFLYSGFWILYFQMFDSVLWYVQAYVDATSLNIAINKFLSIFGIHINWFFDVEHVTVINALTIIILQLIISNMVKKRKALPTMITGIAIGTAGMAILAVSTNIWVFIAGLVLFSVGEMTAHPKFISYIGLVAPEKNKAMYMGYLFLYGVFGSSIGGIVGAKLYVYFVDNLNQPRVLWLIFTSIGIVTIICLLFYNKFLAPKKA